MFCKEMRALDLKIQLPTPGFVEACHAGGRPPPPVIGPLLLQVGYKRPTGSLGTALRLVLLF